MDIEKEKKFIIHFAYVAIILALIVVFFRYVIYYIFPFVVGFFVAFILRPIIKKLSNKFKHEKLWSILCVIIFYLTIGFLFVLLCMKGYNILIKFFADIPDIYNTFFSPIESGTDSILKSYGIVNEDVQKILNNLSSSLNNIVSGFSSWAATGVAQIAQDIPSVVISCFFAIMSSFFMASDYSRITGFIYKQFNDRQKEIVVHARSFLTMSAKNYVIGYGKIMLLTFFELSVGLFILRVDNPIGIAFVIAIFDILPVLGTGGIMIPWTIFEILTQNISLAIGLFIVYVIVTIIRNIVEPKIVGKQVGLHPLLMLFCMYLGAKLFGFLGIFIMPFLILIIKSLNEEGLIHLYK